MKKILLFTFFLFEFNLSYTQSAGSNLFNNSFLHRIDLDAPDLEEILPWPGFYDKPVKMTIDGTVIDSVSIRRKGFTSNEFNDTNPPFKIKTDEFTDDGEYDGLDVLNLHNHHADDHYQRNALAYALYRRAGVPAPRTSFAEVYINGKFVELYTITEDIDKSFLKRNFASKEGSLYKGGLLPNSVIVQEGTIDAYDDYINNTTVTNIEEHIDMHNFFRVTAVDKLINDWDTFSGGSHNFYMYHEPKSEQMHLITWDHNFSFDLSGTAFNSLYDFREPLTDIFTSPEIKPLYLQTFCDLVSYLTDTDYFGNLAMHNNDVLNSNTNGIIIPAPTPIINLLAQQTTWYRDKLSEEGYSNCTNLNTPISSGDIVINEFVATSDQNGVQEPNGGTADWIELYNNTTGDILLDEKYYISDNEELLKKWHFEDEITLSAGEYLILWADKDLHQDGIHTNFKLDKDEGKLFLTYENMTELQNITYGQQELNKGYARVPNGTGNFRIQAYTFNANNDRAVFVNENSKTGLSPAIYPNPTDGLLYIEYLTKRENISLFITDLLGKEVFRAKSDTYIDLNHLPEGNYFLSIKSAEEHKTFKISIY